MKSKMLLAAGVLYLCTMPGFAQDNSSGSQSPSNSSGSMSSDSSMKQDSSMQGDMSNGKMKGKKHHMGMGMGKEKTMTGCIEANGDDYMLKSGRKKVELMSTEDLKPHVGHTVKLTGMMEKGMEKSEEMNKSADSSMGKKSGMSGMEKHFKVTKMEMVSETCMMGKGKKMMKDKSSM